MPGVPQLPGAAQVPGVPGVPKAFLEKSAKAGVGKLVT